MAEKKMIHLLCNAHLDPVWLWEWQEGAAETLSTFRVAVELCEKNDTFIFNHNEVILYQWVQEYEPELFARIKKLVKQGRWHIMGGWYLQPDCNMPCGESFVRQIVHGKNYFKKHFGVDVTTAINFDPFGHTRGLVQILAQSGYDSYLFGRPDPTDCPLPADDFIWVGYDGSEVIGTRFSGWYNSPLGKAREKIEKWISDYPQKNNCLILWGVGNHGGGPSKRDLKDINHLIAKNKDYDIRHSTPEAYFKELSQIKDKLPRHKKDLNPWAVGCYTSQIRIKQKHRLLENELYAVEKMVSAATVQKLMNYPDKKLREAQRDLMFGQFHDILPGSSIQPAEEAALQMMDHGLEIVSRVKARAFFALSSGQPQAKEGQIPIMVYNPHPFKVKQLIECEFNLPDFNKLGSFTQVQIYHKGHLLPCQVEQELSNVPIDWRKRVVFQAELEPNQMNRFDGHLTLLKKKPSLKVKQRQGKIVFKTRDIEVVINTQTGLVDRYHIKGVDYVGKNAFELLVMKDSSDPWDMMGKSYRDIDGRFKLMPKRKGTRFSGVEKGLLESVRIIEDGSARTVVEIIFVYGDSAACQRIKLPKIGTEIEVETRVHWNEKNRMLKLSIPTATQNNQYVGQVAYGTAQLPNTGHEAVAQKWVAVVNRKKNKALTCINDGSYGSDLSEEGLRLSLLRSPAYSCHPWENKLLMPPTDRYTPRIDQGERIFRFWFNAGKVSQRLNAIDREALAKNEKPFALSFFPPGTGRKPKPIALLNDKAMQITAIKKAEKGNDFIIRLFEPTGRPRSATLTLPFISKKIIVNLNGFEIKTLRISPRTGKVVETNLLEQTVSPRKKSKTS